MVRFFETFYDEQILQTLSAKLSWSHFVKLFYIEDNLKRDFYTTMCILVLIELKLGEFLPEHKGQVELYIRWLQKNEMNEKSHLLLLSYVQAKMMRK